MFGQVLEVVSLEILYSLDGDILFYSILHARPGRCFVLPAINTHGNFLQYKHDGDGGMSMVLNIIKLAVLAGQAGFLESIV